ncbi:perforin-1.2 precursor [Danio rerio]|uniref:Perforin 19a n=1 Tax=Danio rerio TaxID=7955 RepID=A0A0R8WGG0_DANRE|nr:perforin-1.2 precursor [Danio rerio]ALA27405.1 perforin 19a [Danio rerio]|eukprot:NP_001304689.1 perforin 1.2 precursor [Danio rerio]
MRHVPVYLLVFWAMLLITIFGEVEIGTSKECENAHFVPGYNLAGEGFDVVTLERKGTYVINTEKWDLGNGTCNMRTNQYMNGIKQKPPAAVDFWRTLPKCSMKVSSQIFESSEAVVEESSSAISGNWKADLSVQLFGAAVGGTHSRVAKFAMLKSKQDKYSFIKHQVECNFYRYHVVQNPPLHAEFLQAIKSLPASYDKFAYRSLISTYGTHYTTSVMLGGHMKAITAIKTCEASIGGLSDTAIKDCLDVEASGIYKALTVEAETRLCRELKQKLGTNLKMSSKFSERQTEIIGGNINGEDLLFSGSSHPNALKGWLESLKSVPDVVQYTLKPLHFLLSEKHPARKGLKKAVEEYITENALRNVCSEPCKLGKKCSARDPCVCVCESSKIMKSNCCPTEKGLATLKVYNLRANGLFGDTLTQTDGYVEIKHQGQNKRTQTIVDNDNPRWSETFNFGHINIKIGSTLTLEVYDEDDFWNRDHLGTCSVKVSSGVVNDGCALDHGTLFFSYEVKCAPSLQGRHCDEHKPSPMAASLADIFSSRNGVLVKDMQRLELAFNNSGMTHFKSDNGKLLML